MRWYERLLTKRLSKNFKKGETDVVSFETVYDLKKGIIEYIKKHTPSKLLIQLPENKMKEVVKLFNISDISTNKTYTHYTTSNLLYCGINITFLYATYIRKITLQNIS